MGKPFGQRSPEPGGPTSCDCRGQSHMSIPSVILIWGPQPAQAHFYLQDKTISKFNDLFCSQSNSTNLICFSFQFLVLFFLKGILRPQTDLWSIAGHIDPGKSLDLSPERGGRGPRLRTRAYSMVKLLYLWGLQTLGPGCFLKTSLFEGEKSVGTGGRCRA